MYYNKGDVIMENKQRTGNERTMYEEFCNEIHEWLGYAERDVYPKLKANSERREQFLSDLHSLIAVYATDDRECM